MIDQSKMRFEEIDYEAVIKQTGSGVEGPLLENKNVEKRKELNEITRHASEFLQVLDTAVQGVTIDQNTGKIHWQPTKVDINQSHTVDFAKRYQELRAEYDSKNARFLDQVKNTPGVIDAQLVGGAVLITYDSSKQTVPWASNQNERGFYENADEKHLGFVGIDINAELRTDGVSPTTTAIHELHHHNLAISDYLFGSNEKIQMATGVRKIGNSALFGKGVSTSPKSGFLAKESFNHDKNQYTALLGREFTENEEENVAVQLRYLDELHSSFLQKKENWVLANAIVYSTRAKGLQWEIVGSNEDDKNETKKLLGYLQSVFIFDKYVVPAIAQQLKSAFDVPAFAQELVDEWPNFFHKIGALIGVARTVNQCTELVGQEWNTFKMKNAKLFEKNRPQFENIVSIWEKHGSATEHLKALLS